MAQKWLDSTEKQKRSNFDYFAKIAQFSLPWQQIENRRTTFCRVPHGELTAKKWLDSIKKQKRSNLKDTQTQTVFCLSVVTQRQTENQENQLLTIIDS